MEVSWAASMNESPQHNKKKKYRIEVEKYFKKMKRE
jgi:hypothetical protein